MSALGQLQITFHALEPSEAVAEYVRKKAAKLDTVHPAILSCRVVLEAPHRHQRQGHPYRVRVDVHVPHAELVADHGGDHASAQDLYAAIDLTFDDAVRRVREHARKHRENGAA